MATKTKAPPKSNGGDVLQMLKLEKNSSTSGYATKMANLLNFLSLTRDIRTGAEIVETGISIENNGKVISFENVRRDFIDDKMRSVHLFEKEENDLYGKINRIHGEMFDLRKIIHSRAKVNTDEKKEKAQKKIDELQASKDKLQSELNELRKEIERLKAEEKNKLEATEFPIKEMREKLELMEGCRIRIDLTTGSYTFPVPTDTPFYREICTVLGLTLPNQVADKKPVIVRMFTLDKEVVKAIHMAAKYVSLDDLRPAMTGINLEISNNKMLVVATDAHRLFKSRFFDVSGPDGTYTYLIPATALKRMPKAVDEDFRLYELKDGTVSMFEKIITPIDARFPDWKVVMPEAQKEEIVFNRQDVMEAVKEIQVYSNKSTSQVNFSFNGEILISAQDIDFSFEATRRLNYKKKTMEDLIIAFNGKFMVECLNTFKTETVTFKATTPTRAATITDGESLVLIMPLMLSDYR